MGHDGAHQRRSVGCPSPLTSVTAAGYSPPPAQQMSTTVYSDWCIAVTPHTVSSSCEEMESFSSLASLNLSIQDCSCRRTFFCHFPPSSDWPPSRSHSRRLTSASSPGGGHQPHPATFVKGFQRQQSTHPAPLCPPPGGLSQTAASLQGVHPHLQKVPHTYVLQTATPLGTTCGHS